MPYGKVLKQQPVRRGSTGVKRRSAATAAATPKRRKAAPVRKGR